MASIRHSISSILTIVIFLVLAVMASVMYSGDESKKAEMEESILYQKTQMIFNTVFSAAKGLAEVNLDKNIGFGKKIKDQIAELDLQNVNWSEFDENNQIADKTSENYWSALVSRFKDEWQESSQELDQNNLQKVFDWQSTERGAEVLLNLADKEYKVILPFRFWNY